MEEEGFQAGNLGVLGPNLSVAPGNRSFPSYWPAPAGQTGGTISAAAILLLALVGNGLLLHRLRCGGCCCQGHFGRRRKMDFLLAHLAAADLYGCGLALLSHFPAIGGAAAAGAGVEWPAGDATCRLLRFLQGSGLLVPSHMLVLIVLERRHMVRRGAPPTPPSPQSPSRRKPWLPPFRLTRGTFTALGWLLALLLALPQAFVYRLTAPELGGRCLSVFAQLPRWQAQAYAVYGALAGFVAPACFLLGACGDILNALGGGTSGAKEDEEPSRGVESTLQYRAQQLPGASAATVTAPRPPRPRLLLCLLPVAKCAWPSTTTAPPRSLPRARARALQLTLALTALFALCGFPRFLLELAWAFASTESGRGGDESRASLLASFMAATNCALNPYVCLLFGSHQPWARSLQRRLCCCPNGQPRRRAHHRHRPPPQAPTAASAGHWLCPCQTKTPIVLTSAAQQEAVDEAQPRGPLESRF